MLIILSSIIVFGIIIFVHELGHFLVAKFFGVGVEKFSIGYPPTMLSHRWGETEYCIGWIPFGGYVKMVDENTTENVESNPRGFKNKPPIVKIAVLAAGPVMNIIMGILLLWLVFVSIGEGIPRYDSAAIGTVIPGMPASEANIMNGDMVVYIDGDTVADWEQMAGIIHSRPDISLSITLMRDDSLFDVICTPKGRQVRTETGDTVFGMIGIIPSTDQHSIGPLTAFWRASQVSIGISIAVVSLLVNMIIGHASLADVGGPVMIAKMAGESAKMGIWQFIMFIAALSINLAVLNLIPLPILDGGQILVSIVEAIRKKAISIKVQAAFQQASFILLIALMLLVTIKDILNLF